MACVEHLLMIISRIKRFVMFLPWKTASQTIALRLMPYGESPYDRFFYFNRHLNRVVHQHITCADFACLPESRERFFLGSFIRNPYDRAYSGFRQLQKDIESQPEATFPEKWIRELVMEQLEQNRIQLHQAEYQFDRWIALVREDQVYEAGRNTNFPLHPSHYWTHVAGHQFVDFIGRVERFETDFSDFASRCGIEKASSENFNVVELEGSAGDDPHGYRYAQRMSSASIDKINNLFSSDFELFGYDQL
jgi:hypothetical protein